MFQGKWQWRKKHRPKQPKGEGVPRDLPTKLAKECGPELARPAAQFLRTITKTGQWRGGQKVEEGLALKKVPRPKSEDDLRITSLTTFLSKIYEKFVVERLPFYISERLDTSQYGGRKGSYKNHYKIYFISCIIHNKELKEPMAEMAAMIDFKKAFNKQNHAILVTM